MSVEKLKKLDCKTVYNRLVSDSELVDKILACKGNDKDLAFELILKNLEPNETTTKAIMRDVKKALQCNKNSQDNEKFLADFLAKYSSESPAQEGDVSANNNPTQEEATAKAVENSQEKSPPERSAQEATTSDNNPLPNKSTTKTMETPTTPTSTSYESDTTGKISTEENSEIKEVISISKDNALKIQKLSDEVISLKDLCTNLTSENSMLTDTLNNLCKKQDLSSDDLEAAKIKNIFSIELKKLSKLVNINQETTTITVNKEILSKSAKFIDKNSLISLEEVLSKNYDLNSTIIQVILLAFIHQNSLI